ncbi:glutamate receptor 2.8 [Fagus crenata]
MQKFDAVIGDTTIVANRSSYVDFTLPYFESGVSMVVLMKDNEKKNMWIFLKPQSWDLWLAIGATCIFTGLVTWVLEHHVNTKGKSGEQLVTIYADHMGLYGSHPNIELHNKLNFNADGTKIET